MIWIVLLLVCCCSGWSLYVVRRHQRAIDAHQRAIDAQQESISALIELAEIYGDRFQALRKAAEDG